MIRLAVLTLSLLTSSFSLAQYSGPAVDTCLAYARSEAKREGTSAKDIIFERDQNLMIERYTRKLGNQFVSSILRATAVYLVLLVIFRIAGKRTLNDMTTFDLVLVLIISEALQQGMVDSDNSMINALLLVVTLVSLDILLSVLKHRFPSFGRTLDGRPVVLVRDDALIKHVAAKERVDMDDVLSAARCLHGIEHVGQIKHAVLEAGGKISVIPREPER